MKNKKFIGLVLAFVGVTIFLYPFVRMKFADSNTAKGRAAFREEMEQAPEKELDAIRKEGEAYNEIINPSGAGAVDPFDRDDMKVKNPLQKMGENEILGYIDIPKIDVHMPIYVGSTQEHLAKGAATIDGTSLPFGGKSTRAVLAGHRGYYDFAAFLDVDQLQEGDVIYLTVLDKEMKYVVYDLEVIYPHEIEKLGIFEGYDVLTLLTCHPYPTNRQRLLVNAVRADEPEKTEKAEREEPKTTEEKAPEEEPNEQYISPKVTRRGKIFSAIRIIGGVIWIALLVAVIRRIVKR